MSLLHGQVRIGDPTANKYAEALGTETAVWDAGVPALFVKVSWRPASRSPSGRARGQASPNHPSGRKVARTMTRALPTKRMRTLFRHAAVRLR